MSSSTAYSSASADSAPWTLAGLPTTVAARDWDAAERHLATALATAKALGNRIEQVDLGFWRARMLGDRDGPGDREAAAALAADVAARYRELGLLRHAELVAALLGPDTAT